MKKESNVTNGAITFGEQGKIKAKALSRQREFRKSLVGKVRCKVGVNEIRYLPLLEARKKGFNSPVITDILQTE